MCICSFLVWKNMCLNYREFDLKGDLVGVPHTWYLSAQSFIRLFKLIWGEYDIVAMNEWKKKWVGLHRTWVSKRTVSLSFLETMSHLCAHKQFLGRSLKPVTFCTFRKKRVLSLNKGSTHFLMIQYVGVFNCNWKNFVMPSKVTQMSKSVVSKALASKSQNVINCLTVEGRNRAILRRLVV